MDAALAGENDNDADDALGPAPCAVCDCYPGEHGAYEHGDGPWFVRIPCGCDCHGDEDDDGDGDEDGPCGGQCAGEGRRMERGEGGGAVVDVDPMGERSREPGEHAEACADADADMSEVRAVGWVLTPQRLREMRAVAGLNQRELALRVSCSWQAIWNYEAATRAIPVALMLPLVEACTEARRERDRRMARARAGFLSLVPVDEL